jgi:hypothetical protein
MSLTARRVRAASLSTQHRAATTARMTTVARMTTGQPVAARTDRIPAARAMLVRFTSEIEARVTPPEGSVAGGPVSVDAWRCR